MNLSIKHISYLLFSSLLIISCARNNTDDQVKLKKIGDKKLQLVLDSLYDQEVNYFYAKVATQYEDTARKVSFKTSIRMIEDSLINTLIKYANIPIMNSLISPDSVIVSNKREKCYVRQSLSYIKDQFGVDFSHKNVEQFILGQPVGYEPELKYFQHQATDGYVMCSHKKKDIKRNERKDIKEIITYYKLNPELTDLMQTVIESPEDTTVIVIDYGPRELVNGMKLPKEMSLSIQTPRQEIKVELNYKKMRLNEVEEIHFVIPEGYEECE